MVEFFYARFSKYHWQIMPLIVRRTKATAAFFIVLALFCASCKESTEYELAFEEMNDVYRKYTEAVRTRNADAVMQYASKRTINYHDSLFNHILYSNEKELKALDLNHRLWILKMRHSKPDGYWDTMTPAKWFLQMPDYDLASNYYHQNAQLATCRIENNLALCSQKNGHYNTGLAVSFIKEDGKWRIEVVTIKPGASDGLKEQITKMKTTEGDYFFYILNTINKIPLERKNLYKPLKPRS